MLRTRPGLLLAADLVPPRARETYWLYAPAPAHAPSTVGMDNLERRVKSRIHGTLEQTGEVSELH